MFRDPSHQAHFERHGFVQVDLLGEPELRELRDAWKRLEGGIAQLPYSVTAMSSDATYRRRVHEATLSVLSEPVSRFLENHRLLVGLFINKARGGQQGFVGLHQDWSFIEERQQLSLGLWCPLADVGPLNGCLFLAPGSHRLHDVPRAVDGKRHPFQHAWFGPLLSEFVRPFPLRAGQALFFAHRLYHGSGPNLIHDERPVAAATCVPAHSPLRMYLEATTDGREELLVYSPGVEWLLEYSSEEGVRELDTPPLERMAFQPVQLVEEQVRSVLEAARVP